MMLSRRSATLALAACLPTAALATNGMNLEAYGPIAGGMGGASMAYDNGPGGMINNPATLGLMASGHSIFAVALNALSPRVTSNGEASQARAFYMPAMGYVRKDGDITWGAGMLAQGGMGTQYANSGFYGTLVNTAGAPVADPGLRNKSEVGVGRVVFPLAYDVNDQLNIGASIDYVWAGMDIQWLIDGAHFGDMTPMGSQRFASLSGSMLGAMPPATINWGYFDFNTESKFSQKAKATGWGGNLGFTYRLTPQLKVGGVYHAKTRLSDLETKDGGATASFNVSVPGMDITVPVSGKVVVRNFQWPETYGLGFAWQATERWLLAADYKRINWSGVMKNFQMSFIASGTQTGMAAGFANTQLDMTYHQFWKDQHTLEAGAAYNYSDALILRFGVNIANNPIPDEYVSPLFPAIVKSHLTGGLSYRLGGGDALHFAATWAPKVSVTNQWGTIAGANQTITHKQQFNWIAVYSKSF